MAADQKVNKVKKAHVVPSAETNRKILQECVRIDTRKVMEVFNCSYKDAVILVAAAELGWVSKR